MRPTPQLSVKTCGGGGAGIGSSAGGRGSQGRGGLCATHYYHMHTSRGCVCLGAWGYRGMYAKIPKLGGGSHTRTGPGRPPVIASHFPIPTLGVRQNNPALVVTKSYVLRVKKYLPTLGETVLFYGNNLLLEMAKKPTTAASKVKKSGGGSGNQCRQTITAQGDESEPLTTGDFFREGISACAHPPTKNPLPWAPALAWPPQHPRESTWGPS